MKQKHKQLLQFTALSAGIGAAGLAAIIKLGDAFLPPVELKRTNAPYASLTKNEWKFGGINMMYDHDGDGKIDEQLVLGNPSRQMYDSIVWQNEREEPFAYEVRLLQEEAKRRHGGNGYNHLVGSHVKREQQRWITPQTHVSERLSRE